jgi:serine phosphatase RsbU (regulator of sigma subunit)/Tfp pilus assembly protein PilF
MGYYFQGDYMEAIKIWESSLYIYETVGDKKMTANLLSNLGATYYSQGYPESAMDYYLRSLKLAEEIRDSVRLGTLLLNLGSVYSERETSLDTAKYYYERAIHLAESLEYMDLLGMGCMNLGRVFFRMKQYDSALHYFERSLMYNSETVYVTSSLTDMGRIQTVWGAYDKALKYQQDALRFADEAKLPPEKINALLGLANTYMEMEEYHLAIDYLEEAKELAEEIGQNPELSAAYKGLSESYSEVGDFRNAFKFLSLKQQVDDVIYRIESENTTDDLMYKYRLDKKQDEIEILEQQSVIEQLRIKRQRAMNIATGCFGVVLLILAVSIYNRMRFVRKTNRKIEAQKNEIALKNELITDSISYAQQIQSALLPSEKELGDLLPEHFIFFKPKDIVSGDFYWIREVQDHLVIVGADCTGHGVPGAFMSMLGITLLNDLVGNCRFNAPGEVLGQLREKIKEMLEHTEDDQAQKDGMDLAFLALNRSTRKLHYSGAYNPLYIIRSKNVKAGTELDPYLDRENGNYQLFELKADKQPVGPHWEERPFSTRSVQLWKKDSLYIFSDGFVDQYGGEQRKKYKVGNFKNLLLSFQEKSLVQQKEILENTFENWRGELEQIDDVSVIGVRL